jgi:hypothetical protein
LCGGNRYLKLWIKYHWEKNWSLHGILNALRMIQFSKLLVQMNFQFTSCVATLALGSRPRQGFARLQAKKKTGNHTHTHGSVRGCEGMNPHTPKGFHFGELESRWTFQFSEDNYRGQISMAWGIPYIIGNLLERRSLKWAHITHLDIWNTSYGQKKSRESNWQFDSQPLKVRNRPDFLACRWRATYRWKALDEGYNFALDLISIWRLHTKLWRLKVAKVLTLAILGLPLGSPGIKKPFGCGPLWRDVEYTIRGKVVASPKSRLWWVLWV